MNTPAHLLLGLAAFARPPRRTLVAAASAGALMPDASLYLMAGVSLYVLGLPPRIVFDELYFSDAWQRVFAIDNSFILWGALLALALWRRSPAATAFAGAGILHLLCDFPLHHDDGRAHFWPLSMWVFESPVSYWDTSRGAGIIGPLEAGLSLLAAAVFLRRASGWGMRALVLAALAAEAVAVRAWFFLLV